MAFTGDLVAQAGQLLDKLAVQVWHKLLWWRHASGGPGWGSRLPLDSPAGPPTLQASAALGFNGLPPDAELLPLLWNATATYLFRGA